MSTIVLGIGVRQAFFAPMIHHAHTDTPIAVRALVHRYTDCSLFRVCVGLVQGLFRACLGLVQGLFSVGLGLVWVLFRVRYRHRKLTANSVIGVSAHRRKHRDRRIGLITTLTHTNHQHADIYVELFFTHTHTNRYMYIYRQYLYYISL